MRGRASGQQQQQQVCFHQQIFHSHPTTTTTDDECDVFCDGKISKKVRAGKNADDLRQFQNLSKGLIIELIYCHQLHRLNI